VAFEPDDPASVPAVKMKVLNAIALEFEYLIENTVDDVTGGLSLPTPVLADKTIEFETVAEEEVEEVGIAVSVETVVHRKEGAF
jgi:hypothetical protein